MVTVSLFEMSSVPKKLDIIYNLEGEKVGEFEFHVMRSRYDSKELKIEVTYEKDLKKELKKVFSGSSQKIKKFLEERDGEKLTKKIECFLNRETKILEIHRGKDHVTARIKTALKRLLDTEVKQIHLNQEQLLTIVNNNSEELKKAMFKYLHGMWYQVLRGNNLEENGTYMEYISEKPDSLRMVSVIPKINWENGSKYMVTLHGDLGTIKMYDGAYRGKPRGEIKQLVRLVLNVRQPHAS